jgi:hypothetical protein
LKELVWNFPKLWGSKLKATTVFISCHFVSFIM